MVHHGCLYSGSLKTDFLYLVSDGATHLHRTGGGKGVVAFGNSHCLLNWPIPSAYWILHVVIHSENPGQGHLWEVVLLQHKVTDKATAVRYSIGLAFKFNSSQCEAAYPKVMNTCQIKLKSLSRHLCFGGNDAWRQLIWGGEHGNTTAQHKHISRLMLEIRYTVYLLVKRQKLKQIVVL